MRKNSKDSVYGKIPPQAIELEKGILGALMIEPNCLPSVMNILFSKVFYVDAHQKIYTAICSLYDNLSNIDTLTVMERLKRNDQLELVGGGYYIAELTKSVVSSANIEFHCRIIQEKYMAREMIRIMSESVSSSFEDSTDVFEMYDKVGNELMKTQESVMTGMVKDMDYYCDKVYNEYETVKLTGVLGIQTGIKPFDKIFCGLVPPDLVVFAARPGQGKTSLALSITNNTSVSGTIPCAWFSLEMDGIQLTRRLACMQSGISHESIRQGRLSKDQEDLFFNAIDKVKSSPVYIEDKTFINIRTIRTRANLLKRKYGIKYIVVDYLQLIKGLNRDGQSREGEVADISRGLKALAKELSIPVIALSQLSREVEKRPDKMPQLSDLRESGAIEQDADEVIFLMRPEYYKMTESVKINSREYDVSALCIGKGAKNRHGSTENFAMWFNAPTMQFSTHNNDVNFSMPQSVNYSNNGKTEDYVF